jgi:hypothetical protein
MNGSVSGLIEAIKYAINPSDPNNTGTGWDNIPTGAQGWWKYGAGGIAAWGTVCGVPAGCVAVLNLMNLQYTVVDPVTNSLVTDQMMRYYEQSLVPVPGLYDLALRDSWAGNPIYPWAAEPLWDAHLPIPDEEVRARTMANSPLCHISASKWGYAAGVNMTEPDEEGRKLKEDRCGKLASDVARWTAEWLNNAPLELLQNSAATALCMSCHNMNSDTSKYPAEQGQMECNECHNLGKPHGPC